MTLAMEAPQYHTTTIRMDEELADRLKLIGQVRGQSKNSLMVAAIKQFVIEMEGDDTFKIEREAMLARWAEREAT